MRLLLVLGLVFAAAVSLASAGPGEHEKIVACYWGAWSFYRLTSSQVDATSSSSYGDLHPDPARAP
jgi:hypothetical protein